MRWIEKMRVKIFSDGANLDDFVRLVEKPYIKGFTTNPTLMRKAGIDDYDRFIQEVLTIVGDRPISFEVISDEFDQMGAQARYLQSFAENIYVKIPVMNTRGESSLPLIRDLTDDGVNVNVTAVMLLDQVKRIGEVLAGGGKAIISVFAGRIADTGVDPVPIMREAKRVIEELPNVELLWASPRELLNIFQAEEADCDIITVLPEILDKLELVGRDLHAFSLDTVKMFYHDAVASGLDLSVAEVVSNE